MSEMVEIIDSLERKLLKLISKIENLEMAKQQLQAELTKAHQVINQQTETVDGLKKQYETLKVANSLLGSDENKRETKLKINSLIREIDYCIAQLAD
jgi:chromosome segregation ATPase